METRPTLATAGGALAALLLFPGAARNADWEWFIPLDEPDERFANRQRIRAGRGYRRSFAWRFEAMYVWNRSRNTLSELFTTTDQIIDLTMKRVW